MKKVFSAVRPSGELQLANLLGAIGNWVKMQDKYDCTFAIVDLHGITTSYDPKSLQQKIKDYLFFYLAAGLDPDKCTLFVQSKNTDHLELAWLLSIIFKVSELGRMTQYKDKTKKGESPTAALFNYPILMVADILLYETEVVPVGEDQVQHVEVAARLAERFNKRFGEVFKIPKAKLSKTAKRIMSLTDPTSKMSKTGEEKSSINLSDDDQEIKSKIMKAVTDSGSTIAYQEDKPAIANLLRIYSACSGQELEKIVDKSKGKGYADFKKDLAEVVIKTIAPIRDKKIELEKDKALFKKVTAEGLKKAKEVSGRVLENAKKAAGLL